MRKFNNGDYVIVSPNDILGEVIGHEYVDTFEDLDVEFYIVKYYEKPTPQFEWSAGLEAEEDLRYATTNEVITHMKGLINV